MAVLERSELEASPLADLHAIADQLGLDGFRRLRKAELIDAILGHGDGDGAGDVDGDGDGDTGDTLAEDATGGEGTEERDRPRRRRPTRMRRARPSSEDEEERDGGSDRGSDGEGGGDGEGDRSSDGDRGTERTERQLPAGRRRPTRTRRPRIATTEAEEERGAGDSAGSTDRAPRRGAAVVGGRLGGRPRRAHSEGPVDRDRHDLLARRHGHGPVWGKTAPPRLSESHEDSPLLPSRRTEHP